MKEFHKLRIVKRDSWILRNCSGKSVLHVGCTNAPNTKDKAAKNQLSHLHLASVSKFLLGIDVAEDAIAFMRHDLGIQNVMYGDAEQLQEFTCGNKFDIIIASDIMEHLGNPGLFLESAKQCLKNFGGGELLITVPMAFSIKRMGSLLLAHDEHPNFDHVAYYSPACLKQLSQRYGFTISQFVAFVWRNPTWKNRIANFISRTAIGMLKNPYLADGLGCVLHCDSE